MSEDQEKTPPSEPSGDAPSAPSFGTPAAPPPAAAEPPSAPSSPLAPPSSAAPPPAAPAPPGASFPPPAGAFPPPGAAYPPPGGGYPPAGAPGDNVRTMILIAHFGGAAAALATGALLGWAVPLVVLLTEGARQPLVRAHAVEALNFQITCGIAAAVALVLVFCTFGFLTLAVMAVAAIFGIIAGVKAMNGEPYSYPLKLSLVK